jgi:hypothetical protein
MNLFKRLGGVFFSPKQTFTALAEKPVWVDVLIVLLLALVVYSLIIMPYVRNDQLQMMKDSVKFRERMGEEAYNRYIQRLQGPPSTWEYVQTVVGGPAFITLAMLLQALFLLILGRFMSSQGTFTQVFSALVHAASVNLLLGNAVRMVLTLTRKSVMQVSTGLALFFPKLEVTSSPYIVLGQVDFFQLWLFGVLAFGLSAIFKINIRKALVLSYSVWLLKALVNIAIGLVGVSFVK